MVNCANCGKKIGLFQPRYDRVDEKGNIIKYCSKCNETMKKYRIKENEAIRKKELKRKKDSEISDMIYDVLTEELKLTGTLQFLFEGNCNNYGERDTYTKKLKNGKFKITEKEIRNGLKNKEINETNIVEFVNYQIELEKLKLRSKQYELRKKTEKEVFGKLRNNRQAFSEDEKEVILANSNNECVVCGAKEGLHIHHKDKKPSNNQMNNLLVLCGVCHKKVHMNVR